LQKETPLLIIGAGPFGLSMAAYASHHGIDYLLVGKPMEFWQSNMPKGMYLRSNCDWHLDPENMYTIDSYLESRSLTRQDVEPLSLRFYLDYANWFQSKNRIESWPHYVDCLQYDGRSEGRFVATLDDGRTVVADNVVLAIGFKYFKFIHPELTKLFRSDRVSHTCDLVNFEHLSGKRCLIIGGRQSAFEWGALLIESGVSEVHIVHRHETPKFAVSDWSWVNPLMENLVKDPGWFRHLTAEAKESFNKRMWIEGRSKLEPWLWQRIQKSNIHLWPNAQVVDCETRPTNDLEVRLDIGVSVRVDHVIFATGYKVNTTNVPLLAAGNILQKLNSRDGFPILDDQFQTNIPGLFATSMMATLDFGSFFAFTVSARAAAGIIGPEIEKRLIRL